MIYFDRRNMFLAAAPYFKGRFGSDTWISTNFQSSILSVSCITNLTSSLVLAKRQKNASYPRRISASILLNIVVFALLAASTVLYRDMAGERYFIFVLVMVFAASLATGMNQNGIFAYVATFDRSEYTQAIMVGQGVAGVLPCIVQMVAVLAVPDNKEAIDSDKKTGQYQSPKSAFIYFATATGVSAVAFVAFLYLNGGRGTRRVASKPPSLSPISAQGEEEAPLKKSVSLLTLFRKLQWNALAMFFCFTVTMAFPVFAAEIHSVRELEKPGPTRLFQPAVFIAMAFLFWNSGDLMGRLSAGLPTLNKLTRRPFLLFVGSLARILFIPLYLMCNIRGEGAKIQSDFFYLFVVQLLFGITNGYLCSSCMMGAAQWVDEEEREAAGAFMSLMLVAGLTAGSLLSFLVAKF